MISNTIEIDHISSISPLRTCSTTAWTTSDRIDTYRPRFNDYRITDSPLNSPFLSTIASESRNSSSNSTDFARSLELISPSMTIQSVNPSPFDSHIKHFAGKLLLPNPDSKRQKRVAIHFLLHGRKERSKEFHPLSVDSEEMKQPRSHADLERGPDDRRLVARSAVKSLDEE